MIEFDAELQLDGRTATGITVPPSVLDALGGGKRPRVRVTINGHAYQSTVGTMGGVAKIPVSAAVREAAGVTAGERLTVQLEAIGPRRSARRPRCRGARPRMAVAS